MAKTINTEIRRFVKGDLKLKTSVNIIEAKATNSSSVIQLTKEQATELAHQLISIVRVIEKDRVALTIFDTSPNTLTVTSY